MFQVRPGETVFLDGLDAAVVHVVSQDGSHHLSQTGFTFTTVAGDDHHLLGFVSRDQTVAHEFLQGGDVLRIQKFLKKSKEPLRPGSVFVVGNLHPV